MVSGGQSVHARLRTRDIVTKQALPAGTYAHLLRNPIELGIGSWVNSATARVQKFIDPAVLGSMWEHGLGRATM